MEPRGRKSTSRLCNLLSVEVKLDFDDKLEQCFEMLEERVSNLSDKNRQDAIMAMVSGEQKHDDVCLGLLYGILISDKGKASTFYRDLIHVTSDGWNVTLTNVNFMLVEWFHKLKDPVKEQMIWFLSESIRTGVPNMDNVCTHALRNIRTGELSSQNLKLTDSLLSLLQEQSEWLKALKPKTSLIQTAVYTFLRLLSDIVHPSIDALRRKISKFVAWLIREKFSDCMQMGRDFVRLLIMSAKIQGIDTIWLDMMNAPSLLASQFTGVAELLSVKTSKRLLQNRIPVSMERELFFMLERVKIGRHERHWEWFTKKYFWKPEVSSIRLEIIRFLLCFVPYELDKSNPDGVKRWHILTWLLPSTLNPIESQFCKMALFWDWIVADPSNAAASLPMIEPVYMLMLNSLKLQPNLTSTLMDFMCRTAAELFPSHRARVKASILAGFKILLEKNIVQSHVHLFGSSRLDKNIRAQLGEFLPELVTKPKPHHSVPIAESIPVPVDVPTKEEMDSSLDTNAAFSDEEPEPSTQGTENSDAAQTKSHVPGKWKKGEKERERVPSPANTYPSLDLEEGGEEEEEGIDPSVLELHISTAVSQLEDERLKTLVTQLKDISPEDEEGRCTAMQQLLLAVLEDDEHFEGFLPVALAECLCAIFRPHFRKKKILPSDPHDESAVNESLSSPFFVIFRNLCLTPESDPSREPLILLVGEMCQKQNKIGYQLLYFLKAFKDTDDRVSAYRDLCGMLQDRVDTCLVRDLERCQADDYKLFGYLIPYVYSNFKQDAMNSAKLMHLVVSTIDSTQLYDIIGNLFQEHFSFFKRDSFGEILKASLDWETIEQFFFWKLIEAEDVPVDWYISIIPRLEYPAHAEALSSILLSFRRQEKEPSTKALFHLFNRDPNASKDLFVVNTLKVLIEYWPEKTGDIIARFIGRKQEPHHSGRRNKSGSSSGPSLENVLGHLDRYRLKMVSDRLSSTNQPAAEFFLREELRDALHRAKKSSESQREKFQELFAMVEVLATVKGHDGSRFLRRGRTAATAPQPSSLGQESSDDEPRRKKPKKKKVKVESDSD